MPTQEQISWAAGFYEGEGHTAVNGNKTLMVVISQCNKEPLEKMASIFGGTIILIKLSEKKKNWNDAWRWGISGNTAKDFINMIYPQLSNKRRFQIINKFVQCRTTRTARSPEECLVVDAAKHRKQRRDARIRN